jgi:hypothetical protein
MYEGIVGLMIIRIERLLINSSSSFLVFLNRYSWRYLSGHSYSTPSISNNSWNEKKIITEQLSFYIFLSLFPRSECQIIPLQQLLAREKKRKTPFVWCFKVVGTCKCRIKSGFRLGWSVRRSIVCHLHNLCVNSSVGACSRVEDQSRSRKIGNFWRKLFM